MANEEQKVEKEMGIMDHINDLRKCLLRCSWYLLISSIVAFIYRDKIFHFLWDPYAEAIIKKGGTIKVVYSGITDPFTVSINQSLITGLLMSFPLIVYEVFKFIGVSNALASKDKHFAYKIISKALNLYNIDPYLLLGFGNCTITYC